LIIKKHFAIILAQLKTVVLIKEAIKLAFFRLVEYLGPCKQKGSDVELYGSLAKSSQPFDTGCSD
jgi:hypothetical protein